MIYKIQDKGCVLEDINPAKGVFSDTSKTPKGKQLKDLHTSMRSQYNLLLSRITASGSHSANEDLILHAYNRCGVENRGKDTGLFFYYMCVKEKDLEFLAATLFADESASEATCTGLVTAPVETIYAKRQRSIRENTEKREAAFTEKNMTVMRSFMSPGADESTEQLNTSIINRNNASADESTKSAIYYETLKTTEDAKKLSCEIKTLTDILGNSVLMSTFSAANQETMRAKLLSLLGLN